jgi:outer membrane protein TolC
MISRLSLCLLVSLAPSLVRADEAVNVSPPRPAALPARTGVRTVTLHEVIERARTNPPAILAALATLQRTQAQESYARGAYIPRVTIEGGTGINYSHQPYMTVQTQRQRSEAEKLLKSIPPGTDISMLPQQDQQVIATARSLVAFPSTFHSTSQNSYGRANFDYALFDMNRRYAVNTARLNSQAQGEGYAEAQRGAVQAATELYMTSVAAAAFVDDAHLTLERRQSQFDAIKGLAKAGLRPSVDATRAEIEAVAARFALETREIELAAAGAALSAAMGDDPTHGTKPSGFDDNVLPAPLDPLRASAVAIQHRPEIRQLELAVQSSRNDHRAAIGARLPTAGLLATGNVSYQDLIVGNGYQGIFLNGAASVYMRWSALDPLIWRRASVTRRAIDEAQRNFEAAVLKVRAEVVDAAYQVQRTRALVDQATQILAAAQAARTAQNERYRAGVASLLDLLDAEGVEQNARRSRIEAERDHRIARVRLLALCGETDKLGR